MSGLVALLLLAFIVLSVFWDDITGASRRGSGTCEHGIPIDSYCMACNEDWMRRHRH